MCVYIIIYIYIYIYIVFCLFVYLCIYYTNVYREIVTVVIGSNPERKVFCSKPKPPSS